LRFLSSPLLTRHFLLSSKPQRRIPRNPSQSWQLVSKKKIHGSYDIGAPSSRSGRSSMLICLPCLLTILL
jgi:hypothetical protein